MENNTPDQKDIFDLTEREFISYFKEKIGLDFEKYKESAASLLSEKQLNKQLKFFAGVAVVGLIIFTLVPFTPARIFAGFLLAVGLLACFLWIMEFNKIQNPNLKYTSKEKLFKAIGFDYFSLTFFWGVPKEENKLKIEKYNAYLDLICKKFYHAQIDEVIQGHYHNIPFTIFDLCAIRNTSEDIDTSKRTSILLATNINKPFKNEIRIESCGIGESNVLLEDIEFNKEFKVFAQDQVEARYLLTPSFMTRLLKYRKEKLKYNAFPEVLFSQQYSKYGNVFIHIKTGNKDMFQFSRWNADNEIAVAKAIYIILQEIKEIMLVVEALKLDQDIGM